MLKKFIFVTMACFISNASIIYANNHVVDYALTSQQFVREDTDAYKGIAETDAEAAHTSKTELKEEEKKETLNHAYKNGNYTAEDFDVLSRVISAEMGGTNSWEDMIYTGSVILNRVAAPEWPHANSIKEVVFDKRWGVQYACVYYDKHYFNEPVPMAVQAAKYLLDNGSQLPQSVQYQSGYKLGHGIYAKTKNAYYCYV